MPDDNKLAWLSEPYEFWTPRVDREVLLEVVRWEVGMSRRTIRESPGFVEKPTLRLWVPPASKPGRPNYWDWTAQQLIHRVLELYVQEMDLAVEKDPDAMVRELQELSPQNARPLRLRIVRRRRDDETWYEAARVEG